MLLPGPERKAPSPEPDTRTSVLWWAIATEKVDDRVCLIARPRCAASDHLVDGVRPGVATSTRCGNGAETVAVRAEHLGERFPFVGASAARTLCRCRCLAVGGRRRSLCRRCAAFRECERDELLREELGSTAIAVSRTTSSDDNVLFAVPPDERHRCRPTGGFELRVPELLPRLRV